ncbi:MAG: glycerate kinase [Leptolyngbyaceae bacterium]|nr:glycerate kinase [Leptolyngbyaceae bacterium]
MAPFHSPVSDLLTQWAEGQSPTASEWQQMEEWVLTDHRSAQAFGITAQQMRQSLQTRLHLFQAVYPEFVQLCNALFTVTPVHPSHLRITLWNLWLPLAIQLAEARKALNRPLIQGVLGGQGTGKTTLGAMLKLILAHLGYRMLSFSLDDLYKTYAERLALRSQDPRLIWRGPPGTHDVDLGLAVLTQLRQPHPQAAIAIPRFDKSAHGGAGDRTQAELVQAIDIVVFEGWFVGVQPIDPAHFAQAPAPIITAADRAFAQDCNARLHPYLPLWQQLDRLIVLHPKDYRLSQTWRKQAEHHLQFSGKSGMTDAEIEQFVEYFWKALHPELFIQPLLQDPDRVDLVIEINPDHLPEGIYRPGDR